MAATSRLTALSDAEKSACALFYPDKDFSAAQYARNRFEQMRPKATTDATFVEGLQVKQDVKSILAALKKIPEARSVNERKCLQAVSTELQERVSRLIRDAANADEDLKNKCDIAMCISYPTTQFKDALASVDVITKQWKVALAEREEGWKSRPTNNSKVEPPKKKTMKKQSKKDDAKKRKLEGLTKKRMNFATEIYSNFNKLKKSVRLQPFVK